MPRRIRGHGPRRRTFLRQWREHRKMTLERAAERFDMSPAQLSRIETAKSPYTQDFLELAAHAYQADVISLLTRDPESDADLWSIWHGADDRERRTIIRIVKAARDEGS